MGSGETEQLRLTAHHEAGHAVAAVMRGGLILSITIEPDGDTLGFTNVRLSRLDSQFQTYAGPWAEARAQWPLSSLGDVDEDDLAFDDYLAGAWLINRDGDSSLYEQTYDETEGDIDAVVADAVRQLKEMNPEMAGSFEHLQTAGHVVAAREATWNRELEAVWPVICRVAQMLLNGEPVTTEAVQSLLDSGM